MIIDNAKQLQSRLVEFRRYFHMYPELGFHEINTSERIGAILQEYMIPFRKDIVGLEQ